MENKKNVMTGMYTHKTDDNEVSHNFNFYTNLSTASKLRFVNNVTKLLVDTDKKRYDSVLRNLVFDFFIVEGFTSVNVDEIIKSNFFVNDAEKFLEETNIVDIVKANIENGVIEELNRAVDLNIQYITGIHPNPLNEALARLINTFEKKVNEVDLSNMSAMLEAFNNMSGEFTPENVVKAYMNTDFAKKNMAEVMEAKNKKQE